MQKKEEDELGDMDPIMVEVYGCPESDGEEAVVEGNTENKSEEQLKDGFNAEKQTDGDTAHPSSGDGDQQPASAKKETEKNAGEAEEPTEEDNAFECKTSWKQLDMESKLEKLLALTGDSGMKASELISYFEVSEGVRDNVLKEAKGKDKSKIHRKRDKTPKGKESDEKTPKENQSDEDTAKRNSSLESPKKHATPRRPTSLPKKIRALSSPGREGIEKLRDKLSIDKDKYKKEKQKERKEKKDKEGRTKEKADEKDREKKPKKERKDREDDRIKRKKKKRSLSLPDEDTSNPTRDAIPKPSPRKHKKKRPHKRHHSFSGRTVEEGLPAVNSGSLGNLGSFVDGSRSYDLGELSSVTPKSKNRADTTV